MSDDADKFVMMPWIQWLGIETVKAAPGSVVIRLDPKRPEHLNHNATVNAPVLCGLAEVAGAGAAVAGTTTTRVQFVVSVRPVRAPSPAGEAAV